MTQARGDNMACARCFRFYGGAADKLRGETILFENDFAVMTPREPFGVWVQIFRRCVAAALAAGNTVVLNPAEDTSYVWPGASAAARSSSTTTVPPGQSNFPSAEWADRAMVARRASRA